MLIDSLYEKVLSKLLEDGKVTDISNKLQELSSIAEKAMYVDTLMKELNLLPTLITVAKSEKVSSHYRILGNESFKVHNDYIAWQYYNLSLLFAPLQTENYIFAVANRSAVLCALKKYGDALYDIDVVRSIPNYPSQLTSKLLKRRQSCEVGLLTQRLSDYKLKRREIEDNLKFRHPTHANYLCASSVLQVVSNETMGRHVIATEDIAPGEVIAKESPYFPLLLRSQTLFSCSNCMSRTANLYPCSHCCFTFYCSKECNKNAWEDYHRIECPILPTLYDMKFTKIELLALRTVIKARLEHKDWESFYKMLEEADLRVNTPLQGHVFKKGTWIYSSKYYQSIHTLSTNVEKRSISDIFQKAVTAVAFLHLLEGYTDFFKDKDDRSYRCIAKLLLQHIMTSPTNMHTISSNCEDEIGNVMNEISLGSAPYAFLSLINHSCAPNVVRYTKLGLTETMLIALRPIKKGMQLFDNYGFHHALSERASRQKMLKSQYKFTCNCEACVNNWPTYLNLHQAKNLPVSIAKKKQLLLNNDNISKLQKGDFDTALNLYKPLCVLLKVLEDYAPCVELADCQESFKQCVSILEEIVPYGCNQHVQWSVEPPVE